MALAAWWKNDPLPLLRPVTNFKTAIMTDDAVMARLNRLDAAEVNNRRQQGHRPYVGYWEGQAVAYGWVATQSASIGELLLQFDLPAGNRYLWDFATLPEFQGRGIYPHLLQAILHIESREAERFWILYAPENLPSGAGMSKAGLLPVGQLSFQADGKVGLTPYNGSDRAVAGADVFGVPLVQTMLAPCWHCGGMMEQPLTDLRQLCWPPSSIRATNSHHCTCAVEIRPSA